MMLSLVPSFFALVIVIALARLIGMLFRKIGQPPVMGEVLGGIILGPSVLGYFFPQFSSVVFHGESVAFLKHIADLGILLYLFVMGLEMDLPRLRKSARTAVFISQLSIVFPFVLGFILASQIYGAYAPPGIGLFEFSLFIGVTLSITAFPVLARILADTNLHRTSLGDLALTCAAANDITAWCLVAIVTGLLQASMSGAVVTVLFTILYIVLMMLVVRPYVEKLIPKLEKQSDRVSETLLAFVILGALGSAALTDVIGIHALFGAFLFGAIIPNESLVARDLGERLQDFVCILFLPAFFATTGMKTQIGLLSGSQDWILCVVIIGVAVLGKFGGTFIAAIFSGKNRQESAILGILMNTRGLVELIVLNIGLSVGVLTPTLFTILVIMAVVTTFMTGPLLKLVNTKS